MDHIEGRKSIHIYGDEGVGKSALVDQVYDFLKARSSPIPIYCRSSRTLREILLRISVFLLEHFKHLTSINKFRETKEIESYRDVKRLNIRTLRNLTFAYITQDSFCIILDHLEYVTPRINSLLVALYEKAPVITAGRESWDLSDYSFKGRLDYRLYLTPKLKIENLSKKDSFLFMERVAGGAFGEASQLFEEAYRMTKGNAGLIREIILKALMPKYRAGGYPNFRLIQLDIDIDKFKT
ncbi:MAG: ATP-binding protein [Nitrospirae bacterium]|nr:ATP-binding protein [Nitrospirota bacterium]